MILLYKIFQYFNQIPLFSWYNLMVSVARETHIEIFIHFHQLLKYFIFCDTEEFKFMLAFVLMCLLL